MIQIESEPLIGTFTTKPLPPLDLRVGPSTFDVTWFKSQSPKVRYYILLSFQYTKTFNVCKTNFSGYRVKIRSTEVVFNNEDMFIPTEEDQSVYTISLKVKY